VHFHSKEVETACKRVICMLKMLAVLFVAGELLLKLPW